VGISERTYQRWLRSTSGQDERRGPTSAPEHALTAQERANVVEFFNGPAYRNLSPEQAVAKAADAGHYLASERTVRRILAAEKLNTYRERAKPATQPKPRELVATAPGRVLSWDITYLANARMRGGHFYLYLFIDVWSRKIVGADVYAEQSAELAGDVLQRVCREQAIAADTAALHADNGSPMKGATMLATMQALGIAKSFSRPGVSDDNPYIESLFRTLKYAPAYPSKGFESLDQARAWVARFVTWYNGDHLHSSIAYVTPDQRHSGRDIPVLEARRQLYAAARAAHPRRWSGQARDWKRPAVVTLNPDRVVETRHRVLQPAA